jgi:hypothetical protein
MWASIVDILKLFSTSDHVVMLKVGQISKLRDLDNYSTDACFVCYYKCVSRLWWEIHSSALRFALVLPLTGSAYCLW